jgi:hypothetical protein
MGEAAKSSDQPLQDGPAQIVSDEMAAAGEGAARAAARHDDQDADRSGRAPGEPRRERGRSQRDGRR